MNQSTSSSYQSKRFFGGFEVICSKGCFWQIPQVNIMLPSNLWTFCNNGRTIASKQNLPNQKFFRTKKTCQNLKRIERIGHHCFQYRQLEIVIHDWLIHPFVHSFIHSFIHSSIPFHSIPFHSISFHFISFHFISFIQCGQTICASLSAKPLLQMLDQRPKENHPSKLSLLANLTRRDERIRSNTNTRNCVMYLCLYHEC